MFLLMIICSCYDIDNKILIKIIAQIGKCSYSIYLYQFVLNFKDYSASINNFIFLLIFVISFGIVMYYLIEKPFEKIRKILLL